MLRTRELRILFRGQNPVTNIRVFSAQAAKVTNSNFQDEWNNAKSYESIPALTKLQAIRSFLPGGEFFINRRG